MQEKYNKPDTEKDLSEVEVSMSCLLHQAILFMEQFTELSDKKNKDWNSEQVDNLEAFLV